MKKIFSIVLMTIIAILFTSNVNSYADETLGTLSLSCPDLSKVVTIKKGEELRLRFEVKDAKSTCWVFVSNLNKKYLEGSALSINILDEKGNIINSSNLNSQKSGVGLGIRDVVNSKTFTLCIKDAEYSDIDKMSVGISIYVEELGGSRNDFLDYINYLGNTDITKGYDSYEEFLNNHSFDADNDYNGDKSETTQTSGFTYISTSQGITITGYDQTVYRRSEDYIIKIPETIDRKPVTVIADNAFENLYVEELYLPNTIIKIGDNIIKSEYVTGFYSDGTTNRYEKKWDIYYDGTISEYKKIEIGQNDSFDQVMVHHLKEKVNPSSYNQEIFTVHTDFNERGELTKAYLISYERFLAEWTEQKANKKYADEKNYVNIYKKDQEVFFDHYDKVYLTKNGKLYYEKYDENGLEKKLIMNNVSEFSEPYMYNTNKNKRNHTFYVLTKKGVLYELKITFGTKTKITKNKLIKNVKSLIYDPGENDYGKFSNYFILTNDNTLWGLGNNGNYELGQGNKKKYKKPVKILNNVSSFLYIFQHYGPNPEGEGICFAIRTDGTLWGWGINTYTSLRPAGTGAITKPKQLMDEIERITYDSHHVLALRADGELWTWGSWAYDVQGGLIPHANVPLTKISDNVKYAVPGIIEIYYITEDNTLFVFSFKSIDSKPVFEKEYKEIMKDVRYVTSTDIGDYVIKNDGTQYEINDYVHGWADEPTLIIIDSESKSDKK